MAGGFKSLLANWIGGAGTNTSQGGINSLFAPWMGGAGTSTTQGGYAGLFGFWMGGAGSAVSGIIRGPLAPLIVGKLLNK